MRRRRPPKAPVASQDPAGATPPRTSLAGEDRDVGAGAGGHPADASAGHHGRAPGSTRTPSPGRPAPGELPHPPPPCRDSPQW